MLSTGCLFFLAGLLYLMKEVSLYVYPGAQKLSPNFLLTYKQVKCRSWPACMPVCIVKGV